MNANAPLMSTLIINGPSKTSEIILTLGADLGDTKRNITLYFDSEQAIVLAHVLRQAEHLLAEGKPGSVSGQPSICIDIDIDLNRGGIVLTAHLESGEHYFFLRERPVINRWANGLREMALSLQQGSLDKQSALQDNLNHSPSQLSGTKRHGY